MTVPAPALPWVVAAPGMPAHLVRKHSEAALRRPDASRRTATLQPATPHRFRLRCSDDVVLDVGPSRFSVLQLRHDTVHRIFTTLDLTATARAPALALGDALLSRLESAGFRVLERVERELAEQRAARDEQVRLAELGAPFGSGAWRAELWLRTLTRKGSALAAVMGLADDACLVTLVVGDRTVMAEVPR